jgi:hypothetical protein
VHTQPIYSLATMKVRGIFNAASQQLSPPIVEAHSLTGCLLKSGVHVF